ncbi:MAG: fumarylacetoacetate hydrolase family protein [Acidobacteriaceae bacterium]|nr:fumarylacetoacetate hydrolase family protein [Acidobacteriaceae bacterium]MBV9764527.1 fumarylacetoacetate hydrolase family protein [Acidobacteriaceae bacterium]
MATKLYRGVNGEFVDRDGEWYRLPDTDWHDLTTREDLAEFIDSRIFRSSRVNRPDESGLLAPIAAQEVWAAGVTYYRSRTARMEESQTAGGGSFYDRVYHAERPELFFKSSPHRVVGSGAAVRIRKDSKWNVPEPELALLLTPSGKLIGYTVGNDMSSRDIEGENPLYLPQAKVYDRSCALGPGILVSSTPIRPEIRIQMEIVRAGGSAFSDETTLAQMKRTLPDLIEYLFRENSFPNGCFLLTGTGIIPPDDFSLAPGDRIRISIDEVGTLENFVE